MDDKDPTVFRKIMNWQAEELAREQLLEWEKKKEEQKKRYFDEGTKPLALAIVLTALFGTIAAVLMPTTKSAIISIVLIFISTVSAAYGRRD